MGWGSNLEDFVHGLLPLVSVERTTVLIVDVFVCFCNSKGTLLLAFQDPDLIQHSGVLTRALTIHLTQFIVVDVYVLNLVCCGLSGASLTVVGFPPWARLGKVAAVSLSLQPMPLGLGNWGGGGRTFWLMSPMVNSKHKLKEYMPEVFLKEYLKVLQFCLPSINIIIVMSIKGLMKTTFIWKAVLKVDFIVCNSNHLVTFGIGQELTAWILNLLSKHISVR